MEADDVDELPQWFAELIERYSEEEVTSARIAELRIRPTDHEVVADASRFRERHVADAE